MPSTSQTQGLMTVLRTTAANGTTMGPNILYRASLCTYCNGTHAFTFPWVMCTCNEQSTQSHPTVDSCTTCKGRASQHRRTSHQCFSHRGGSNRHIPLKHYTYVCTDSVCATKYTHSGVLMCGVHAAGKDRHQ